MNLDVSPDGTADRLRPAWRHLHDADWRKRGSRADAHHRAGRPSTCSRGSVPTASASRSRATATGSGTSGRSTPTGRTRSRSRRRSAGSSTARPGRPTAATSLRGAISWRSDRSAPARSGCSTRRLRRAAGHREERLPEGRRASRRFRRTAATSITARTSRPASSSNTTRIRTARSTRSSGAISTPAASGRGCQRPGRIGHAAGLAGRQVARLRAPRPAPELAVRPRSRDAAATGASFDHLDKDLQEAWAIHGLYPQYAWTPDSKRS